MSLPNLEEIKTEDQALTQSMALNRITMKVLEDRAKDNKRMFIALLLSLVINLAIFGGLLGYATGEEVATTTTTTTVDQNTNEGAGNNIYQAGENATYSQVVPTTSPMVGGD